MMKFNYTKLVIAGVVYMIISQIIHTIEAFVNMPYYTAEQYMPLWSKIMMPGGGMPGTEFYVLSIIFGVITGIIFTGAYALFKDSIPGDTPLNTGLNYGFILFLLNSVTFTMMSYLILALPLGLLVSWTISALVIYLIGGVAIVRIYK